MKKRSSPMIEVRHSPVHGYGVFALRKIRKGTTIMEYIGDRVSHEEADARYENKDPNDNHTFLFTVDSKTVIDGGVGGNDARYINHGCDPNCESAYQDKRIYVEAVKTIMPGEELAYDYQIQRDPEDPPNVDEIFACRCGAEKCRGSMLVARKKPRKKKKPPVKAAKAKQAASKYGKTAGKAAGRKSAAKSAGKSGKKAAKKVAKKAAKKALTKAASKKSAARTKTLPVRRGGKAATRRRGR
jgi:uncharacterized protein